MRSSITIDELSEHRVKSSEERFNYLVKIWHAENAVKNGTSLQVIGSYKKSDKLDRNGNEFGYFEEVRDLNGDVLFYPFDLGPVRIYTRHRPSLLNSQYWLITVELNSRNYDNPFELSLSWPFLFNIPKNSFKDKIEKELLIKRIFEQTGYTKTDAKNEANALRRLMGDLYTETERFVFELLQNADDQPNGTSRVDAHLTLLENQLLFTHNGKPFDREDVTSICSIGDSTKKNDAEKIGYKGIGFKSVFSDSDTVFIHSGNFSFSFDKESWYYKDIENIDEVPWQIKPIWAERYKYPHSVQESESFFKAPVGIVLGISAVKSEEYSRLIPELLSEPRFLLFLRNIDCLTYSDYKGHSYIIRKKKNFKGGYDLVINDQVHSRWITTDYIIDVPQETRDIIENDKLIPSKLKEITKVKISFSAMLSEDGTLIPVPEDKSILFTYLPTKVNDFKFPFLVNTDFLTTASRETIHFKNPWNIFLFERIGAILLEWVVSLSSYGGNYLSLIPDFEEKQEDKNPRIILIKAFYSAFKESIKDMSFILSSSGKLLPPSEVILDKSGLSVVVGPERFCKIIGTQKHLPSLDINKEIFSQSYYSGIETITINNLKNILEDNEEANFWYRDAKKESRDAFLNWLSDHSKNLDSAIQTLALFEIGSVMVSPSQLTIDKGYLITNKDLKPIKDILERIGFKCTEVIEEGSKLSSFLPIQQSTKVFNAIVSKVAIRDLSLEDKLHLVKSLSGFENVGTASIASIAVFHNACGDILPMASMIPFQTDAPEWLLPYMIAQEDYSETINGYLVPKDEAFERILFLNLQDVKTDINTLYKYYQWSDNKFTKAIIDSFAKKGDVTTVIDIVIASDKETQKYYLGKIAKLSYSSESNYDKDSFGSKVLQLALSNYDNPAESFSPKVFFDGTCILEFSVSDSVRCGYGTAINRAKIVTLSLARILPDYENKSDSIGKFKSLFSYKEGLDKLFISKEKSLSSIYEELNSYLGISHGYPFWKVSGNASQFLFTTFYRRVYKNWNNAFVPNIDLSQQTDEFITEMMDILFKNDISIPSSPFTYHLSSHIVNKYLYSEYVSCSSILDAKVEAWANNDEKKGYLLRNGVKPNDCTTISFRKAFVLDQDLSTYERISDDDAIAAFNFLTASNLVEFPVTTDNRISFLLKFISRPNNSIIRAIDIEYLQKSSQEMTIPGYSTWHENHYPQINEFAGKMPMRAWLRGHSDHILIEYSEGDYYYNSSARVLYINSKTNPDELLFQIAREGKSGFDLDDYRILFRDGKTAIPTEELNTLYQTRDDLIRKNQEQAALIREYERRLGITKTVTTPVETISISRGPDSSLSKSEQCDAQLEAQRKLMEKMPEWGFPDGFGESDEDGKPRCFSTVEVITENGMKPIVLKSYKNTEEPFKINPNEWISLMEDEADLLIYTGDDILIYPIKSMIQDQSNVTVSFSTVNMDVEERVDAFAESLRYFNDIHFDFKSFILSNRAKSIRSQYNTRDGRQINPTEDAL